MTVGAWSVVIGDGASALTLDNFEHEPEFVATPTENGRIQRQECFLNLKGIISKTAPAAIAARALALAQLVTNQITPVHVQIFLDGVSQWDFQPSALVNSPIITRFHPFSTKDGSGESFWQWEMIVYILGSGRGDGTIDLDTSLETVKVNGKTVRKTWRANAKASSASAAEGKVRTFQPAETKIREMIALAYQRGEATGTWIWDARKAGDILSIEEKITISGQGAGYEFSPQINAAGDAPPIIHRKPFSGVTVIIEGTVKGLTSDIEVPGPHFTESETMVRDFASERIWPEAIPDGEEGIKLGIFRREYMEVWKSTGDPGTPDHHDHAEISLVEAPGDGAVAGAP